MRRSPYDSQLSETDDRKPFAVIDIGSNSVRMVVYESLKRAALPVFNEKVLCGLGRGVAERGRLDTAASDLALRTLQRYAALSTAMGIGSVEAVATAAIRDSADGADFVARVQDECGISVRILSGNEEGYYSALGVAAAIPTASGVVADLGGGSLELVGLDNGTAGAPTTLPLGPFHFDGGLPKPGHVDDILARTQGLGRHKGNALYCVGGVWRTLARVHMRQHQAPLKIVHEYRVTAREFSQFAELLTKLSPLALAALRSVPSKRAPAVPVGALVLCRLILALKPSEIVFCGYGLREGLVHSHLPDSEQQRDPFIAFCEDEAALSSRFALHVEEVLDWLEPVLGKADLNAERLRRGAILLSELAWRGHSDYRAEQALIRILHAPFVGLDHRGRAVVALAVYERYRGVPDFVIAGEARKLLDQKTAERALTLGKILDLAQTLSGGAPGLLPRTSLALTGSSLCLTLPADLADFAGEVVRKRHNKLARYLGVRPEVAILA
ncbi:Ppx/GppA family phosphatase [bacterium]|nr:Ppx/GppA family phosphatase [bacterium]